MPVQNSNEEGFVTQYDKDNIEELGLLKMDFLGLRTLTVMGDALKLIKANRGIDLDLDAIPLDDKEACELLTRVIHPAYSSSNPMGLPSSLWI